MHCGRIWLQLVSCVTLCGRSWGAGEVQQPDVDMQRPRSNRATSSARDSSGYRMQCRDTGCCGGTGDQLAEPECGGCGRATCALRLELFVSRSGMGACGHGNGARCGTQAL